jgi:GNAT superfamily N-acetyltransferase
MVSEATGDGPALERLRLDLTERRFWRGIWESVPAAPAAEHGIELRGFGPVQASIVADLPAVGMLNLVLGATEPGAVEGGHLAAATEWARSLGVEPYVPVTPATAGAEAAEAWLAANGFERGYAWMKFTRDAHPPRFAAPGGVEVVELSDGEQEPFAMIAATGFGLPAWASTFFARLPGGGGWRCYVAHVGDAAQACAAMLIDDGVAELGIAATLEPARGRGCQLALLHRRILDAASAGCQTLFVETGERIPGQPSASYRNILRAGFEEAYLRPNWHRA